MSVIRPDGLQIVDIAIDFNFLKYSKLEIDLHHINRGKKLTRYTNFSTEEVLKIVKSILNDEVLESSTQKDYGDEICDHFDLIKNVQGKNYKIVFCICSDRKDTIGIITLFRVR